MKKIFFLLVLLLFFGLGYRFSYQENFANPYPVMCKLVSEKIYLTDDVVRIWRDTCLKRSHLVESNSPKKLVIQDMNNMLDTLKVSHLEVYDPKEVRAIWQGERLENGIESEFVDGELVILKIHSESPAAKAGLKFGDIIKEINGEQPNPWEANSEKGKYTISRGIEIFEKELVPVIIKREEGIKTSFLNSRTVYIQVPSFRAEFFKYEKMENLKQDLKDKNQVVLDLRGNLGGNFVAGLRLASLFLCEPTSLGYLQKPRSKDTITEVLPDNLEDAAQIEVLEKVSRVELKTAKNDQCFKGHLKILVDGKSASVAELIAQSLKEVARAQVVGAPTSGQMLVGLWYAFDELSPGVQISIPEAVYVSPRNYQIEGVGVQLDKNLTYDLGEMQAGIDSWVKNALD